MTGSVVSRSPEPAGPTQACSYCRIPWRRGTSWGIFKPCLQHPFKAARSREPCRLLQDGEPRDLRGK